MGLLNSSQCDGFLSLLYGTGRRFKLFTVASMTKGTICNVLYQLVFAKHLMLHVQLKGDESFNNLG